MQQAYYSSSINAFLQESSSAVLGQLSASHAHELLLQQRNAWIEQLAVLRRELAVLTQGWIALEYAIPRMGKRADAIIVTSGIVFVVEFKVGSDSYSRAALDQVTDYALDLKNFHAGSHDRRMVPLLVSTDAEPSLEQVTAWGTDGVAVPLLCTGSNLGAMIRAVISESPDQPALNYDTWSQSGYKPTPTIVEAAQALYGGHRVEEISRSDAGAKNLSVTADAIAEIIRNAKSQRTKAICFVTGVPGAGKTLAGLNLVTHQSQEFKEEHAVFLSGNGPLVEVLREALARDDHSRSKLADSAVTKRDAHRKVRSFIQNMHHFRDENLRSDRAPIERVAVFDEAQRAWDMAHARSFMAQKKGVANFDMSEPEFLISVMDRHTDWCTIVCLIGGGQEINAGEAGLTEWFAALRKRFVGWSIFASPVLAHRDYNWGQDPEHMIAGLDFKEVTDLHLGVSVRSFRAERLSEFVGAVVAAEIDSAREAYLAIHDHYPLTFTRSLQTAKHWLRMKARGSERFGLVASSGASRLKPEGINVHEKIKASNWFLNDKSDVRSSYYLEDPATEFDIQGLELDWVGVCWDADLRWTGKDWSHHNFHGTVWQHVKNQTRQTYLSNAYRVLLTRARQGMIIYVPQGDIADPTRQPNFYDGVAEFLQQCGLASCD